jgi:hypothetical protein
MLRELHNMGAIRAGITQYILSFQSIPHHMGARIFTTIIFFSVLRLGLGASTSQTCKYKNVASRKPNSPSGHLNQPRPWLAAERGPPPFLELLVTRQVWAALWAAPCGRLPCSIIQHRFLPSKCVRAASLGSWYWAAARGSGQFRVQKTRLQMLPVHTWSLQ